MLSVCQTLSPKLTSDCDFNDHFAVAHIVAGHTLVAASILGSSQVDLEIPSANLSSRGQVSVYPGPSVGQRRSAVGQALQPDHLPDTHSYIIGQRSGIRRS